MGVKRIVDTAFWTDGKVDDFSPEDKYFMLYLLTNPFTKQLGIYEISVKQAAFQMGYSVDAFNVLLDRFENKYGVIVFSKETSEVAIVNFLRHSVMKGGKPVEDCIRQDMERVKNKRLIEYVFSRIQGREGLNSTVKKIVDGYMNDIDNDIHNDNDNDNDRTDAVSYHDTPPNRPVRETTHTLFKRLVADYVLPSSVQAKMAEWIKYKTERKEPYKEQGMKSLLRQVENNVQTYGEWAVCDLIDECMASNWKGIIFDRLKQKPTNQKQTKADELDSFYNMAADWAAGG